MSDLPNVPTYLQPQPSAPQQFAQWYGVGNGVAGMIQGIQARGQAEAQAQSEAQKAAALEALRAKAVGAGRTAEDIANYVTQLNPQASEQASKAFSALSMADQQQKLSQAGQVMALIKSGNAQDAADMLKTQAQAYRNAGTNLDQAEILEKLADHTLENPQSTLDFFMTSTAALPGGKDIITPLLDVNSEPLDLKKLGADIGYTEAQTAKLLADLNDIKEGRATPEQRFTQEKNLREEAANKTAKYAESERLLNNITISANDASGAGDYALITSFVKMLDPTSVVRETEFAAAQDTAGLLSKLVGQAKKVANGEILLPEQRKAYRDLAAQFYGAAASKKTKDLELIGRVAKSYGLDLGNIVSEQADTVEPTPKGVPSDSAMTITLPDGRVLKYPDKKSYDSAVTAARAKGLL